MKTYDSKKKELSVAEILMRFLEEVGTGDVPFKAALGSIVAELGMENASVVQFGNTVFGGHRGKGRAKMMGRVFNIDTAENFVANMLKYVGHLQEEGITHYVVQFEKSYGEKLVPVLKKLKELITPAGGNIHLGLSEDGEDYVVFVLVPERES
tara:strand:- start:323 stop:781 length:459 start_codon:yes stop_codon:yes gene_type:complete